VLYLSKCKAVTWEITLLWHEKWAATSGTPVLEMVDKEKNNYSREETLA